MAAVAAVLTAMKNDTVSGSSARSWFFVAPCKEVASDLDRSEARDVGQELQVQKFAWVAQDVVYNPESIYENSNLVGWLWT